MNEGVRTGPLGWMETQTQRAAAGLCVPLPDLMPSGVLGGSHRPILSKKKHTLTANTPSVRRMEPAAPVSPEVEPLRPVSLSFSLSDFTQKLCPGAHLPAAAAAGPAVREGRPGYEVAPARAGTWVFRRSQRLLLVRERGASEWQQSGTETQRGLGGRTQIQGRRDERQASGPYFQNMCVIVA